MRQRAFNRPVPIKTNLTVKAELHEDKVVPLPLTPLTPRTEQELRRSCRSLLVVAPVQATRPGTARAAPPAPAPAASYASPAATKYQHFPSNAAHSFNLTTANANFNALPHAEAREKLDLVRHLYEKPHPPPPPPLVQPESPLSPTYTFTPSIAKKFSVCELRPESLKLINSTDGSAAATPVLRRRPTLVEVSHNNRPRTADMRSRRVMERINQAGSGEKEKLALFPARPSTSHHAGGAGAFKIDLVERPLPPLPAGLKPVQRSKSDSEVVLGKPEKESKGLRGLRKQIAVWFGRKKNESAAAAA